MMDEFTMKLLLSMLREEVEESSKEPVEMNKLKKMLDDAGIPYRIFPRFNGEQLCYFGPLKPGENPAAQGKPAICSVIFWPGSYGYDEGLLEISGLMTREEVDAVNDTVLGSLTAENVFNRIQKHYKAKQMEAMLEEMQALFAPADPEKKAMGRLETMLKEAGIPYSTAPHFMGGIHLTYRSSDGKEGCSVIQNRCSHGYEDDLLEISGLGIDCFGRTPEVIFQLIQDSWNKSMT